MTDYLSVRSNFVLGPLVLKVEKSFGRGAKRETKRATATTTQMIGRINLRVVGDKVTLHSIKVQQPKQVKFHSLSLSLSLSVCESSVDLPHFNFYSDCTGEGG